MKKTFSLTAPNKEPARQVEWTKHEIKKYLAREKRKTLLDGVDFWDFDCRIGKTEKEAKSVFVNEIRSSIDQLVLKGEKTFYLEILAKSGKHNSDKTSRRSAKEDTNNKEVQEDRETDS